MRFKIISVGWNCAQFLMQTLRSIEAQTLDNYDVMIVDDATDDLRQRELIKNWCDSHDDRWHYTINDEHKYSTQNQYEAIIALNPTDDDVIVWLDLDGDQFAHSHVLERLTAAYSDETLLTYGSYRPVPFDPGTCPPCDPFPANVVATNTFRQEILRGFCHFNHLRTMKGLIFRHIPKSYFFFQGSDRWYDGAADYVFMVPGLELAGARYKHIPEVLCLYNHGNPLADNINRPAQCVAASIDSLQRVALQPLLLHDGQAPQSSSIWESSSPVLFMTAEERRIALLEAARKWGLRYFVETGTSVGDTPLFMQPHFDQVHSIELDNVLFEQAMIRLKPYNNIYLWHGDSGSLMHRVLTRFDGPALIWLDGHYCGPGSARGSYDTPVRAELEALFDDGRPHVIYIDDARIFDGGPEHHLEPHYADYPSLDWVRIQAIAHGYHFELKDDIIRLTPRTV